jgi:UDP-N-acetyl-D-mannosaminuronic acid dehydrogenase
MMKEECKEIIVHDPYVKEYEGINLTNDLEKALENRDCIAISTKHGEYFDISLDHLKETLSTPIIIDGRNVFNPTQCRDAGFTYKGIGIG